MALGRTPPRRPIRLALVFWGLPIVLMAPRPDLRARASSCSRSSVRRTASRTSPLFTLLQRTRPGRDADPRARRRLEPRDGRRRARLDRRSRSRRGRGAASRVRRRWRDPAVAHARHLSGSRRDRQDVAAPSPSWRSSSACRCLQPLSDRGEGDEWPRTSLSLSVSAGEVVIRAGDRGDRFYIVADGELDDHCGGRLARPPMRATTSARSRCCETCRARRRSRRSSTSSSTRSSGTTSSPQSQAHGRARGGPRGCRGAAVAYSSTVSGRLGPARVPPDRYKPLRGVAVGPPLEPGTRLVPRRRDHEAGPVRVLPRDRAGARSASAQPPVHDEALSVRCRRGRVLSEAGAEGDALLDPTRTYRTYPRGAGRGSSTSHSSTRRRRCSGWCR